MKILTKKRFPNGRRRIYLMGMKIFSYRRKKMSLPPSPPCIVWDHAYIVSENIFTHDGCEDFEYEFLKSWFSNKDVLADYDVQTAWLIFMSLAYERQDYMKAKTTFWHYYQRFGDSEIEKYPMVCQLATSLGITNALIDKMIAVESKVKNIRTEARFENMIKKAKSIAVVGRSPILIGQGLGEEIDSHEIVIRFNLADVSGKYANDFGVKNDVMVINCRNKNDHSAFCLYKDFRMFGTTPEVIDAIYHDDCQKADFLDFGLKKWCCHESGLVDPTSGTLIIMWIQKILGNLDKVDIYGFSFQDEEMRLGHYDGDYDINNKAHNMRSEIEYLRQIIKKR